MCNYVFVHVYVLVCALVCIYVSVCQCLCMYVYSFLFAFVMYLYRFSDYVFITFVILLWWVQRWIYDAFVLHFHVYLKQIMHLLHLCMVIETWMYYICGNYFLTVHKCKKNYMCVSHCFKKYHICDVLEKRYYKNVFIVLVTT